MPELPPQKRGILAIKEIVKYLRHSHLQIEASSVLGIAAKYKLTEAYNDSGNT